MMATSQQKMFCVLQFNKVKSDNCSVQFSTRNPFHCSDCLKIHQYFLQMDCLCKGKFLFFNSSKMHFVQFFIKIIYESFFYETIVKDGCSLPSYITRMPFFHSYWRVQPTLSINNIPKLMICNFFFGICNE